ncbi:MAG: UDP-N-acetylmuramoyl-tripeptide--D-alanyl-D-alanine ligase [Planctomycetota bacterium]
MRWTLDELAAAAGGAVDGSVGGEAVAGVVIDSRRVEPGCVFVALRGERVDGHDHAAGAIEAGAVVAIVERAVEGVPRERQIVVEDAIAALGAMAAAWRDRLAEAECWVVAVVGSNGKTSTRHLIWGLLNGRRVRRPAADAATDNPASWSMGMLAGTEAEASFNNHLGVPLTLLNASCADDFVVCEIGTNAPGEIEALSRVVRPDAVVMTSIGAEHLEGFGNIAGVVREEGSVMAHVREHGLIVIDDEAWAMIREALPGVSIDGRVLVVGKTGVIRPKSVEPTDEGVVFDVATNEAAPAWIEPLAGEGWFAPLHGRWAPKSAVMGLVVGRWLGVDATQLRHGLAAVTGMAGRMERLEFTTDREPIVVWHDAYNANPDSVVAALDYVEALRGSPWLLVMGDMLELGHASANEHDKVHQRVESMRRRLMIERVAWVGDWMGGPSDDASVAAIAAGIGPGDRVLLKGSRGMRLERVVAGLSARWGEPRSSVEGLGTAGASAVGVVIDR